MGGSASGEPHVFAARSFGPLAHVERHRLTFPELVECGLVTCRLVKEILAPVACRDESEPVVADETFDRAGSRCHTVLD